MTTATTVGTCGTCNQPATAYTICCDPRQYACPDSDHRQVVVNEHRRHRPGCACTQRMLGCHQGHRTRWHYLIHPDDYELSPVFADGDAFARVRRKTGEQRTPTGSSG